MGTSKNILSRLIPIRLFKSSQRLITPLRGKETYSGAVAFATATCQTLKGLRRKEVYSGAVAFATATCQFLEVYFKYSLFFRIFISYCITITYKNTHISFYIF